MPFALRPLVAIRRPNEAGHEASLCLVNPLKCEKPLQRCAAVLFKSIVVQMWRRAIGACFGNHCDPQEKGILCLSSDLFT